MKVQMRDGSGWRKYNRVVQTGMQHRSAPHYQEIEEIIQSGGIGDVHFVRVWNYGGAYTQTASPDSDPPPGVDWDIFCSSSVISAGISANSGVER